MSIIVGSKQPTIVTQLPTDAKVGETVFYAADAATGIYWQLMYDELGSYPWKFVGGSPMCAENNTYGSAQTSSGSWQDLSNLPSITLPFDGDYAVTFGGRLDWTTIGGASRNLQISAATTTVAATGNTSIAYGTDGTATTGRPNSAFGRQVLSGVTGGEALKWQFLESVGPLSFVMYRKHATATPVRVAA